MNEEGGEMKKMAKQKKLARHFCLAPTLSFSGLDLVWANQNFWRKSFAKKHVLLLPMVSVGHQTANRHSLWSDSRRWVSRKAL